MEFAGIDRMEVFMDINEISQMTRHELMDCISRRKSEIVEKLKNGETEATFAIGAETYTCREWERLINRFDKTLNAIKEEQEQRKEALMDEKTEDKSRWFVSLSEDDTTKRNYFLEKLNGTYKERVPYEYLAKDGVISYNGVIFVCDEEKNAICLGDMSDKKNVLTIPLSGGGSLMVNRDNLGDLSAAISMFSPEDVNRIMRAIADDKKAQEAQAELEEDTNSIGDDAEQKVLEGEIIE